MSNDNDDFVYRYASKTMLASIHDTFGRLSDVSDEQEHQVVAEASIHTMATEIGRLLALVSARPIVVRNAIECMLHGLDHGQEDHLDDCDADDCQNELHVIELATYLETLLGFVDLGQHSSGSSPPKPTVSN